MKIKEVDLTIEKMKKKLLQINRNPFLPDTLKMDKLKKIDKWLKDTQTVRDNFVKTLMEKGS